MFVEKGGHRNVIEMKDAPRKSGVKHRCGCWSIASIRWSIEDPYERSSVIWWVLAPELPNCYYPTRPMTSPVSYGSTIIDPCATLYNGFVDNSAWLQHRGRIRGPGRRAIISFILYKKDYEQQIEAKPARVNQTGFPNRLVIHFFKLLEFFGIRNRFDIELIIHDAFFPSLNSTFNCYSTFPLTELCLFVCFYFQISSSIRMSFLPHPL